MLGVIKSRGICARLGKPCAQDTLDKSNFSKPVCANNEAVYTLILILLV